MFPFEGHRGFNLMLCHSVLQSEFHALHVGFQVVARVFKECTYAKIFARFGLVKPILTLDIIFLLFFC